MRLRRKRFIRHDVQLQVVFTALCVASLVLVIQFQLSSRAFADVAATASRNPSTSVVLDEIRSSFLNSILVSVAVSIPLSLAFGVLYSFKFAGPIHAIRLYFDKLAAGRWTERCRLRNKDGLLDLRDSINKAVDPIMEFLGENRAVMADARRLIGDPEVREGEATMERAETVLARLDAIERTFTERFSEPDSQEAPASEPATAAEQQLEPQA